MSAGFRRWAAPAGTWYGRTAAPATATRVRTRRDRRVTSVLRQEGGISRRAAPVEYLSVYGLPGQTQWRSGEGGVRVRRARAIPARGSGRRGHRPDIVAGRTDR